MRRRTRGLRRCEFRGLHRIIRPTRAFVLLAAAATERVLVLHSAMLQKTNTPRDPGARAARTGAPLSVAGVSRRLRSRLARTSGRGRGHACAASNGLGTPDILRAPTKHYRYYSMPQPHRRRHGPQPDRRRALELLAASRDGCTETMLRAHGFSVRQIVDLVGSRLRTANEWLLAAAVARSRSRGSDHGGRAAGAGGMTT